MTPNLFRERKVMGIELNNKELIGSFEKKLLKQ
jgi:hypothetical protein